MYTSSTVYTVPVYRSTNELNTILLQTKFGDPGRRPPARPPPRAGADSTRTRRAVPCSHAESVGGSPGPPGSGGVGAWGRRALRGGGKGAGRCGVALCGATPCTRTVWGRVVERGAIVHNFPAARCRCCDGALLRVCAPTPRSALPG